MSRRNPKVLPPKDVTLDKLQSAAGRILVRSGLRGATTRRIAAEAGLSEMTLFRRFGTKERLLSAVMDRLLLEETARVPMAQNIPGDLRTQLLECAKAQVTFINRNLPLIRIFVGDPEHFGEEQRNVLREVFAPMRREIRQILANASLSGAEIDLLVHLLAAIIFVHVLRLSRAERSPYSASQYLSTAVDMILAYVNERKALKQRSRTVVSGRRKRQALRRRVTAARGQAF
ncbi:MAG TPA: TetR/AcrR family transcriptional regulator [Chthoniobacterales bacterium]|nr:TetR/AcrR family transcriptional regulator [Chthoniobacterales bacterium]